MGGTAQWQLTIDGALNLRDIGGLPCRAGGSTRHGVLLRRRLGDSTAFPLGAWPRSTVDTDARVTDGDASGWRPR